MSLIRKAASNLACPAKCWVLPAVWLHGRGAWGRSGGRDGAETLWCLWPRQPSLEEYVENALGI